MQIIPAEEKGTDRDKKKPGMGIVVVRTILRTIRKPIRIGLDIMGVAGRKSARRGVSITMADITADAKNAVMMSIRQVMRRRLRMAVVLVEEEGMEEERLSLMNLKEEGDRRED